MISEAIISLFSIPIHRPPLPCCNNSTAYEPNLLANTRSRALGEPPRTTCPRMDTRVWKSPYSESLSAKSFPPITPSAKTIKQCFFPRSRPSRIRSATTCMSKSCSGMMISSAPPATPDHKAISPAPRPITSITNVRTCDVAVSRIRSIDSKTVLIAVSKPIVKSVPGMSLSIVPGIPIAGKP